MNLRRYYHVMALKTGFENQSKLTYTYLNTISTSIRTYTYLCHPQHNPYFNMQHPLLILPYASQNRLIVNHQNELFIFIVGTEFPLKCYQPNVKVRVFGSIRMSVRLSATSFAGLNLFILHLDATIFH